LTAPPRPRHGLWTEQRIAAFRLMPRRVVHRMIPISWGQIQLRYLKSILRMWSVSGGQFQGPHIPGVEKGSIPIRYVWMLCGRDFVSIKFLVYGCPTFEHTRIKYVGARLCGRPRGLCYRYRGGRSMAIRTQESELQFALLISDYEKRILIQGSIHLLRDRIFVTFWLPSPVTDRSKFRDPPPPLWSRSTNSKVT